MPPKPSSNGARGSSSGTGHGRPRGERRSSGSGRSGRGRGRGRGGSRGRRRGTGPRDHTRELSRLEALPPALFHHVVDFCGSISAPNADDVLRRALDGEYDDDDDDDYDFVLDQFAFVSKAVRAHTMEIVGQHMRTTMDVVVRYGSRPEILALRRRVVHRRAFLHDMKIEVGVWLNPTSETDADRPRTRVVDHIAELVSQAPHLKRLDLRLCEGDVSPIVRAAATSCRSLQTLLLPTGHPHRSPDGQPPLLEALYVGMQQWHRYGGSLRHLQVPSGLISGTQLSTAVDFFLRVYTYCPQLERLDGAFFPDSLGATSDRFFIDRTVWEWFCATCTQLRGLDWLGLPWTTDFLELFAKYPKPALTDLTLRTSMTWDWNAYFEQVGRSETAAVKTRGYGATANRVHLVFQACRSLKRLRVELNSRLHDNDTTRDTIAAMDSFSRSSMPPPFKRENAFNIGLVSDTFCQTLARSCPLLETFSVMEDNQEVATAMQVISTIQRFQDPALEALARLKHLSEVTLPAVNVTGDGIFALVNAPASEAVGTRHYALTIGDFSEETDTKRFYTVVLQFLKRLLHHKGALQLLTKRVFLRITNGHDDDVERRWSNGYLRQFKGAIRALRRKYPTLTFRVDVDGLQRKTFEAMYAFGVYTADAMQPDDSRWIDVPEDALVEDVFVKEEVMEDYEDDDDLYSDEYYDDYDGYGDEEDDDEDADADGDYGDYQNERGHYGMGGHHFFNGLQLPDIGPLSMHGGRGLDEDDHDYFDHGGYDY